MKKRNGVKGGEVEITIMTTMMIMIMMMGGSEGARTPEEVEVVHVVTMNHLDVGFNV